MGSFGETGAIVGAPAGPVAAGARLLNTFPTPAVIQRGGIVLTANKAAQALFGFDDEASMRGFNVFAALDAAEFSTFARARAAEFAAQPPGECTPWKHYELDTRTGQRFPASIACSLTEYEGQPAVFSFFVHQTSDLALDYALRYSREVAVLVTDPKGRVVWSNPASTTLTGYTTEELRGKTPGSVLQVPATDPAEIARLGRHIRAGSPVTAELLNRTKHGREYWARVELLPARSPDGSLFGYVGLQADVTEEVVARQRREQARDAVLATFSHEVRTPLNVILNLLDLLQDAPLQGEHAQMLRDALDASQSLKDLVNNVLDTRRLSHQDDQLPPRPTHIPQLIAQLAKLARGYRHHKAVELKVDCPQDLQPVAVRADLLLRVLLNLVSNALKYTPAGSVTIRVEKDPNASTATHKVLRFSVADTGIGISEEDQQRILQPFETVGNAQTEGQDSTGLGLSLVERMLAMMGSKLALYSVPGQGTTVSFELHSPVSIARAEGAQEADVDLSGMRVMAIDDNALSLMVTRKQLERRGAQVQTHDNATAALEALFAAGPGHFHVVLSDLNMPGLGGLEAARRIRLRPGFEQQVIIGLSGEDDTSTIERAMAAGMADFIQKPFDVRLLTRMVGAYRPAVG